MIKTGTHFLTQYSIKKDYRHSNKSQPQNNYQEEWLNVTKYDDLTKK